MANDLMMREIIEKQGKTIEELGKRARTLRRERDAFYAAGRNAEKRAEIAEAQVAELEEALDGATARLRELRGLPPVEEEAPVAGTEDYEICF